MSEQNKDLYESAQEQINKIKEIEKHHKKLEKKSYDVQEKYEVLWKISDLSKKLWAKYDVKVAISPIEWAYFLQINWNKLDIEIKSHQKLDKIIKAVEEWLKNKVDNSKKWKIKNITWFWDNKVYLTWDVIGRSIKINDSILPTTFDSEIIDSEKFLNKNEVEEIFVFLMNIKWIKKEDWEIEATICRKNTITDECKEALWEPNINPNNY